VGTTNTPVNAIENCYDGQHVNHNR